MDRENWFLAQDLEVIMQTQSDIHFDVVQEKVLALDCSERPQ